MGIRSQALATMLNYQRKSTLSSLITQKAVSHFHRPPRQPTLPTPLKLTDASPVIPLALAHMKRTHKILAYFILLHTRENRTRAEMKGESVFATDIGTEQRKDNVVCESCSP